MRVQLKIRKLNYVREKLPGDCLCSNIRHEIKIVCQVPNIVYVCVSPSVVSNYNPMDYSQPDSSIQGIPQARILEWAAIPFSRGSSRPRDQTQVSSLAGRFFTV